MVSPPPPTEAFDPETEAFVVVRNARGNWCESVPVPSAVWQESGQPQALCLAVLETSRRSSGDVTRPLVRGKRAEPCGHVVLDQCPSPGVTAAAAPLWLLRVKVSPGKGKWFPEVRLTSETVPSMESHQNQSILPPPTIFFSLYDKNLNRFASAGGFLAV